MRILHIVIGLTVALVVSWLAIGLTRAETFRDAGGRTTGTATTDSQGTTTFRDAGGRTTGTATHSNQGSAGNTTTFRDAGGRTTGTVTKPFR